MLSHNCYCTKGKAAHEQYVVQKLCVEWGSIYDFKGGAVMAK